MTGNQPAYIQGIERLHGVPEPLGSGMQQVQAADNGVYSPLAGYPGNLADNIDNAGMGAADTDHQARLGAKPH